MNGELTATDMGKGPPPILVSRPNTEGFISLSRQLSRPYGRVDRAKLKRKLLNNCIAQGKDCSPIKMFFPLLSCHCRGITLARLLAQEGKFPESAAGRQWSRLKAGM